MGKKNWSFDLWVRSLMASWSYVVSFLIVCIIWAGGNLLGLFHFDPTTFLLNLCLSLLAAIQGSIIMIAQNKLDEQARVHQSQIDQLIRETHDTLLQEFNYVKEENKQLRTDLKQFMEGANKDNV